MQVECRFYGPFREDVGKKRITYETDVDETRGVSFANQKPTASGDAETLGELLSELAATYPELEGKLIENGEIAGSTVVTRNKKDVRHLDGPSTQLSDGDVIRLTPSVYGG